jgi:Fe-Mn family superoxide dismutase
MPYELPKLPYALNALEPYVSAKTLEVHYGQHHRAYVEKTSQLVAGTALATRPLDEVIAMVAPRHRRTSLFNNAAQAWNHAFYWDSMSPDGGIEPLGALAERIRVEFMSFGAFEEIFKAAAVNHFGSGWAWLILDGDRLRVITTSNADTPIAHGKVPLLTLDLWEHAYYLDYQNRRGDHVAAFLGKLANWKFAERNYQHATHRKAAE